MLMRILEFAHFINLIINKRFGLNVWFMKEEQVLPFTGGVFRCSQFLKSRRVMFVDTGVHVGRDICNQVRI